MDDSTDHKPRRIIYPPIWLVIGLVTIFTLGKFFPIERFTSDTGFALGSAVIVVGLLLLVYAGGLFKQAETDLVPFKTVSALVTTGIYRYTRNPMYLGMALVLLGTSMTVGAYSGVLVAPLFMAIIEWRFIRPEEALLRHLFADEFDAYCERVRRWI